LKGAAIFVRKENREIKLHPRTKIISLVSGGSKSRAYPFEKKGLDCEDGSRWGLIVGNDRKAKTRVF